MKLTLTSVMDSAFAILNIRTKMVKLWYFYPYSSVSHTPISSDEKSSSLLCRDVGVKQIALTRVCQLLLSNTVVVWFRNWLPLAEFWKRTIGRWELSLLRREGASPIFGSFRARYRCVWETRLGRLPTAASDSINREKRSHLCLTLLYIASL